MSYDSANLTTPDIKWLGVRPSDLNRFNIPKQCRIKMTEEDLKTGKKMVRCSSLTCPSRVLSQSYHESAAFYISYSDCTDVFNRRACIRCCVVCLIAPRRAVHAFSLLHILLA